MDLRINKLLRNAVTTDKADSIFLNREVIQQLNHTFNNKINIEVLPTDQQETGRCWIFSFLNMLRLDFIRENSLPKNFEFSQTYLFFMIN